MSSEVYEVISLAARYWFTLLGVLIVWRSFRWLRKDRKAKHRRLKQLPDAGMIGELVVLEGSDELPAGTALPLPREGTLGRLRTCDVTVPVPGVAPCHLDFSFQNGKGLLIYPRVRCLAQVDGDELNSRSKARNYPMHHGSRLTVGDAVLRLRLFVGLETEQHAAARQPISEEPPVAEAPAPTDWQNTPYVYHQVPAAWGDQTGQFPPVQGPDTAVWQRLPYEPPMGMPIAPAPLSYPPQPPMEAPASFAPITEQSAPAEEPAAEEEFQRAAARGKHRPFMRRRGHVQK